MLKPSQNRGNWAKSRSSDTPNPIPNWLTALASETGLQSSYELLTQKIFDLYPALLFTYDLQTHSTTYVNSQVESVLGYTSAQRQAMQRTLLPRLLHPDDLEPTLHHFEQFATLKDGEVVEWEYRLRDGRSQWRWLRSRETILTRHADGTPHQILAIAIDVTDAKQAEHAQPELQELYHQMFVASRAIKLLIDPQTGQIVDANPAAAEFYGYAIEQLRQMQITDLNTLPASEATERMATTQQQQAKLWLFQHRLASGEMRQVEVYSSVLQFQGRKLLHSIIHDVTERHRAETALQFQHEKEQLIWRITQNIRQTLNLKQILQTAVNEVQQFLQADRVLIYKLEPQKSLGKVLVEACNENYSSLVGWQFGDSSLAGGYLWGGREQRVRAIANVQEAGFDDTLLALLQAFEVQSQLVMPLRITNGEMRSPTSETRESEARESEAPDQGMLWGLLIAHQCHTTRQWRAWEIEVLEKVEPQLVLAIQQSYLYSQVTHFNRTLEAQVQERTAQLERSLNYEALVKGITDKIRDFLDEALILETVVQEIADHFQAERCYASLYDGTQATATILYDSNQATSLVGTTIPLAEEQELYQTLLHDQKPVQLCRLRGFRQSATCALVCPIVDDQGVLGDLWVIHQAHYDFDSQDVQLVQQVAVQCAIALRQSRLYETACSQVVALEKLNRLKDDFLSTISHELRTPLSNIKMSVQLLALLIKEQRQKASVADDPSPFLAEDSHYGRRMKQCLTILEQECDREIGLINDLLTLQQLDAGIQPLISSTLNLNHWLPQVAEVFEDRMQSHQQTLTVQLPAHLPTLTTDLFLFNRLMGELLTNAYKFTPAGEWIRISAQVVPPEGDRPSNHLQISVTNSGVEIPQEELERIFDKFYRIPSHDPWRHGGTGLGLALVRKLATYLGGRIWATSGGGQTCFTVELPSQLPLPVA